MYKGGRPQNPYGNIFYMLLLEIRNMQSAKSVIISNNNNAARMQVLYTKCSMDSVSSAMVQ